MSTLPLRVALVWNGTLVDEKTLDKPTPVVLGDGPRALFALPEQPGLPQGPIEVLTPSGLTYKLRVLPFMGGKLALRGRTGEVRELFPQGGEIALAPTDYGVLTFHGIALFFQHVRGTTHPITRRRGLSLAMVAAALLSAVVHLAVFWFFVLAAREQPIAVSEVELQPERIARFLVTPPPEDILEQEQPQRRAGGTDMQDPGFNDTRDQGGRRHRGEEGRFGDPSSRHEQTQIAGDHRGAIAIKVRQTGLLGILAGGGRGDSIDGVLANIPSIAGVTSGLGSSTTVIGRGSGGWGLRGTGTGGGGTGQGVLFGAGNMGTGVGSGTGGGLGRGSGGLGLKGRPAQETRVRVTLASPRVSGYLSPEQIARVVRAHSSALRYCYEVEVQRQPSLRGRIVASWQISLSGSVSSARIDSSTMSNPRVEGCIARQIRRWHFPQPDGGEVRVSFPFVFGVQGG